ncbi:hypothetical protein CDD80_7436 [Ophiocordyceps camponoti-rufipedis]|uniref:Protein kinase domain-containing protein n=1 Tax=Ophiocordyceps camponoti-rufipedis TaxID=2004952 RepID=A0A2C5YNQ1_9HYPO|nr:hypothetical protein CDD80_7436 [Ophiocordyceps camponoti-rufipedis]
MTDETDHVKPALWRRILGKPGVTPLPPPVLSVPALSTPALSTPATSTPALSPPALSPPPNAESKLPARKVVTGLPRAQTFKRQQSEQRVHLSPITTSLDERRAASADRRDDAASLSALSLGYDLDDNREDGLATDAQSVTTSQHDAMINDELESTWILNLSMHFRDRSRREKFFVTYREKANVWRRVTISLDYRLATPNSLEDDLVNTQYQREKSAKIYEAIRESLLDIKFYDTVTNLKLETTNGRLHVHVVEDGNEIINYPLVKQVRHLSCKRVRERDITFDSHMSGFVYKVRVDGEMLIKKEIPSQDTVDEFLYEVNALSSLRFSRHIVTFYGVVVDDTEQRVKGLLISYASRGALIDIIYDHGKAGGGGRRLPWSSKEKWARQMVQGLADIHESGFVQGDFTLSNIVIDDADDAKIIDINRRGCPLGWEPPEATALLELGHRISMYIGVKSDLYQLGMVLWGLAMDEDEPEALGRPLLFDGGADEVPDWYRHMTEICLDADPRMRLQASTLLQFFPKHYEAISVDDGTSLSAYLVDGFQADGRPLMRSWPCSGRTYVDTPYDVSFPTRGRSPPSLLPSDLDLRETSRDALSKTSWLANRTVRPSYTDIDDAMSEAASLRHDETLRHEETPTPTACRHGHEAAAAKHDDDDGGFRAERASVTETNTADETAPDVSRAGGSQADGDTADVVRSAIFRETRAGSDDGAEMKGGPDPEPKQEGTATTTMDGPRPSCHQQESDDAEEPEYVAAQQMASGLHDWTTTTTTSLPLSLTGVGAAHIDIDEERMREKSILDDDDDDDVDDDFGALMRPATVPVLMTMTVTDRSGRS